MNVRKLGIEIAIVTFLALCVAMAVAAFAAVRGGSGDSEQAQVGERVGYRQEERQDPAPEQTTLDDDVAEAENERDSAEIGRDEAEEAALGEIPGEVVETGLDDENGRVVYSVDILGDDGNLHEVAVDASNGDILGRETENRDGTEYQNGFDD